MRIAIRKDALLAVQAANMPKGNRKVSPSPAEPRRGTAGSMSFGGRGIGISAQKPHNDTDYGSQHTDLGDHFGLNPQKLLSNVDKVYHSTVVDMGIDELEKKSIILLESLGFSGDDLQSRLPIVREFAESVSVTDFFNQSSKVENPDAAVRGFDWSAFQDFANQNQWKSRRDRGFDWQADIFNYVETVYKDWIELARQAGTPLTQADLGRVDQSLYNKLQQEISKHKGAPDGFSVPPSKNVGLTKASESDVHLTERKRAVRRKAYAEMKRII